MLIRVALTVLAVMLAQAAFGQSALTTSPIPPLRDGTHYPSVFQGAALYRSPIPRLRGENLSGVDVQKAKEIAALVQIAEHERQEQGFRETTLETTTTRNFEAGVPPIQHSLIPRLRPRYIGRIAKQAKQVPSRITSRVTPRKTPSQNTSKRAVRSARGSVCGVSSIKGVSVARISGSGGCGIANPVKISSVGGVALTREITVNCTAAKTFDRWVSKSAKPIVGRQGGGLAAIQVIGGYSCRTRNSQKGAKLSEHAKGNAVDIAGFKLRDGTIYSVQRNWNSGRGGSTLRSLHKSACGPWGTVLGPNANKYHKDHFHFDTARYRSSSYCR